MNKLLAISSIVIFPLASSLAAPRKGPAPESQATPELTSDSSNPASPLELVHNGQPRVEIVLAPTRPRMTTLAALELRHFIEKLTGARLPIVMEPTAAQPVKIYLGQSPGTEMLGITAEGLKDGAYRMVSGSDWIVLIGKDLDFDPSRYSMAKTRGDTTGVAKWAAETKGKTDSAWGYPFRSGFKGFWGGRGFLETLTAQYGEDAKELWPVQDGDTPGFWEHDEAGSLNAVYGFLKSLGARWFMAGEMGEVLPKKCANLTVGPFNHTVVPDYAVRDWTWYNYSTFSFDDVIWARRLGRNSGFEQLGLMVGPHGLVVVHSDDAMKQAHPEYYALVGGKRDTEHRGHGTPCFTSEGLLKETVNYIRHVLDTYDLPTFDVWPVDGLKACQCENCKGKSPSGLVWGFADRVARDVYKTHPEKLITSGAYSMYIDAPDTIEKFSPNLAVWITNAGRAKMTDPDHWEQYEARVKKWQSKVAPGNVYRTENNRYHIFGMTDGARGTPISYPVIYPRAMARDLKALKGISGGENGEQAQIGGKWRTPALDHLNLYVQSRFLWDANLDVDGVLDEYYAMFFGPAAKQMKAAIDFAERNLAFKDESRGRGRGDLSNVPLPVALKFRDLLDAARMAAGDGIHGQRVQAMINDLQPREAVIAKYEEAATGLATARASAPLTVAAEGGDLASAKVYKLLSGGRQTGPPSAETTFRAAWDKGGLLLDIICQEPEMAGLKVSDDVNNGDYVAISIETANHSYYHIEINPDGEVVEGDPNPGWKSLAEVKTERGPDSWRVQVRIAVVGNEEAAADPMHRVAGAKPTPQSPWYFNIGRVRVANLEKPEPLMFSPTGGGWHLPGKFGRIEVQ